MLSMSIFKRVCLFSVFILNCLLIVDATSTQLLAQSSFSRNDNYDFAGKHHLWVIGENPDNYSIKVESNSDFHNNFKLEVKFQRLLNAFLVAGWYPDKYRVDMNNDGTWDQDWASSDKTINFNYPNPANGISETHTIKVEILWFETGGDYKYRTKYHEVTVFSTPRVYMNSENDVFVQLRDEDCSSKIPVLLVEGFDPLNENYPEKYYNLTWDLVNSDLYPNGYEVFILEFNDAGSDLRLNADVVLKSLEKIHEICPNYQIALAGLSMGGLVSRYALSKKEDQSANHEVGLFMSYDSPQDRAHISPELQDWIKGQDDSEPAIAKLKGNLESIAAKQMLWYDTYDQNHTLSNEFFNELNELNGDGYPHQSYNVALSNGNLNATWGYGSVGRDLMTLKINDNLFKNVSSVQYDCGTGSKITDITMTRYGDVFPNPFISVYYELSIIFNPVFIPTWSGLDLVDKVVDGTTGDITSFDHSKFDDFEVQSTPLEHHELSTLSRNSIMDWLDLDFNIETSYNLISGGSVDPDNYQVNILHGLPIEVQPQDVDVNGRQVTYNFLEWEDGNTSNPRTFYASHDVTHTAQMKGHLASNNSQTTGPNNGRRMVKDDNDKFHLVYEDNGDIYYTNSTDCGKTWSPEVRINSNSGNSHFPSIAKSVDMLFVTWLDKNDYDIKFRRYNRCTESWYDEKRVVDLYYLDNIIPKPAIAVSELIGGQFNIYIFFHLERMLDNFQPSGIHEIVGYRNTSNDGSTWEMIFGPIVGKNPSISHSMAGGNGHIGIVWDNDGEIYFKQTDYWGDWSSTRQISDNQWYVYDQEKPNISFTFDIAHIVWQGMNDITYMKHVYYRYYDLYDDELGDTYQLPCHGDDTANPSISTIQAYTYLDCYDYTVFYEFEGDVMINKISKINGNFSEENFDSGKYPNIVDHGMSRAVWTKYNSAPYFIESDYVEEGPGPYPIKPIFPFLRLDYILDPSGNNNVEGTITLELCTTTLNNDTLCFNNALRSDTMFIAENYVPLELEIKAYFHEIYNGLDDEEIIFSLSFNDVSGDIPLTNLKYKELPPMNGGDLEFFFKLATIVNLSGKEGTVELKLVSHQPIITHVLKSSDGNWPQKKSQKAVEIPITYRLYQNYPNPFNPVTHITFDLPEAGDVKLDVYNIKGQKVSQVMHGFKEAGIYEVIFDGKGLASGVYFYRLEAGKFSAVKRMLLVK